MKLVFQLILLLLCATALAEQPDPKARKLLERSFALTGGTKGLYGFIPKRSDLTKSVLSLRNMLDLAHKERRSITIYCPNPDLGARVVALAFAGIKPGRFRGLIVVCALGKEKDAEIRSVVEATGAKLYAEPLP